MSGEYKVMSIRLAEWTLMLFTIVAMLPVMALAETKLPPIGEDFHADRTDLRDHILLSGEWELHAVPYDPPAAHEPGNPMFPVYSHPRPETDDMIKVQVPGVWQNQGLGMNYHGAAVYEKSFEAPTLLKDQHLWLHVEMAASLASVRVNGQEAGSHTGAWTPFNFDITSLLEPGTNRIEIKVIEAPEHYTSGFIKNTSASFGGLWGDVWLETRPEQYVYDMHAWIDPKDPVVIVQTQISENRSMSGAGRLVVSLKDDEGETVASHSRSLGDVVDDGTLEVSLPRFDVTLWSPEHPVLYTVEATLVSADGDAIDRLRLKTGFRRTTMDADHFYVNGKPILWTAILHWGCYPQYLAPLLTKEEFRQEIRQLKKCGFNGVNVCLFMFPERYYEVADEEGMMLWQEYPLWFYDTATPRPETREQKDSLIAEFREMFALDRHHPSVVLRSMACEDPQADDYTMRRLYQICHEMIPGSLAQDNTSFLTQKYADFFDMHPYEEDEDFVERMKAWTKRSRELGDKPFLFGEGLDNDTFRDYDAIEAAGEHTPWWTDKENCLALMRGADVAYWNELEKVGHMKKQWGSDVVTRLVANSRAHSWTSRKFQIEQARLYEMFAGMSITAIRDVICTRPGIFDELGHLKWTPQDLRVWNAPTMMIFDPTRKSRCYVTGEMVSGTMHVSNYGDQSIQNALLSVALLDQNGDICAIQEMQVDSALGSVRKVGSIDLAIPKVSQPAWFSLEATMRPSVDKAGDDENESTGELKNNWTIWVFPMPDAEVAGQWAKGIPAVDGVQDRQLVRVVDTFTPAVETYLQQGGRVLLLQSRGKPGLPVHDTPFDRESALLAYDKELFLGFPWQGVVDHQFYGLGGTYAFDVSDDDENSTQTTTLFRTINCRHLAENDYIVAKTYGRGMLIATTFGLLESKNPSARWLFDRLIRRLEQMPLGS